MRNLSKAPLLRVSTASLIIVGLTAACQAQPGSNPVGASPGTGQASQVSPTAPKVIPTVVSGSGQPSIEAPPTSNPIDLKQPKIVIVSQTSPTDSSKYRAAQVTCPTNHWLLGGGAHVGGAGNGVRLVDLYPPRFWDEISTWTVARNTWFVNAEEVLAGYSGQWSVTAYAICRYGGPNDRWIFTHDTVGTQGAPLTTTSLSCPSGKKVSGVGGQASSTEARAGVLDTVQIKSGLSGGYAEATRDENSTGAPITATVDVICINPLPGQQVVTTTSPFSSVDKTITAPCPTGTAVTGTGASLVSAKGQAHIVSLVPHHTARGDYVKLIAREDSTGYGGSWRAEVYAICVSEPFSLPTIAPH